MAITVYQVFILKDKFQYLEPEDDNLERFDFDGSPREESWTTVTMELANPKKKRPDFLGLAACLNGFAVERDLYKQISQFFDQAGEMLPVKWDGRELMTFNCTNVLNCLDKKKSQHAPKLPSMIHTYVFNPKRFKYWLFMIPETSQYQLLTVEGLESPNDEFKPVVEKMGLKGLAFKKLWSDEG